MSEERAVSLLNSVVEVIRRLEVGVQETLRSASSRVEELRWRLKDRVSLLELKVRDVINEGVEELKEEVLKRAEAEEALIKERMEEELRNLERLIEANREEAKRKVIEEVVRWVRG